MSSIMTPERRRRKAERERERRKRIKEDPDAHAHVLKLKREAGKRYRAKRRLTLGADAPKERKRKPLVFSEAMQTVRCSQGLHCCDCQKWRPSYCSITCAARFANSPMCRYGARLHNNEECKRRYHERKEAAA